MGKAKRSWGITARGELRTHFTHAIDLMPTVLEVLGIEPPLMMKGVPQEEIAGASLTWRFLGKTVWTFCIS